MIGKTLSHYEILEKLGQGGMGEVWRAHDTTLHRDVALKLLPIDLASDPERLARFRREAKVLASLNHPNIAAIHGFEEVEGQSFLVMEVAEGEDLSARIGRGPIPPEEAMEIARQLAIGLEYAHEKGVVHRDLKPANVKLARDGSVKILDFGLARAYAGENGDEGDVANSPTITAAMTLAGTILGTASYMSPEQAKGRTVDRRADIWAFGVILYEMLCGSTLFEGESISETLAGVLKEELDWSRLPDDLPPALLLLLHRCLERDPKLRLRDMGEARILLADPSASAILRVTGGTSEGQPLGPPTGPLSRWLPWTLAAILAVVLIAIVLLRPSTPTLRSAPELVRSSIEAPDKMGFHLNGANPAPAAISPDGKNIVFGARDKNGMHHLWLRRLDQEEPENLQGTESAQYPFWAPDGHAIGFFAKQSLKIFDLNSRSVRIVTEALDGKGGCWLDDDTILYSPTSSSPVYRVAATGGTSSVITDLNQGIPANSHRHPRSAGDGAHFLFAARLENPGSEEPVAVMLGSLDGTPPVEILRTSGQAEIAGNNLLFRRGGNLYARNIDLERATLTGNPTLIAKDCGIIPGASLALFSATAKGTLIYHPGYEETDGMQLMWLDKEGNELGQFGTSGGLGFFDISPDGRSVVFTQWDNRTGTGDLWIQDIQSRVRNRLTFDSTSESNPVWSPDGSTVYYLHSDKEQTSIAAIQPDSRDGARTILEREGLVAPVDVSPDGKYLSYIVRDTLNADRTLKVEIMALDQQSTPSDIDETLEETYVGMFSPDGRWIAFVSRASGDWQLYLKTFPLTTRKWQVTNQPAFFIDWDPDGKRIYHQGFDSRLYETEIDLSGEIPHLGKTKLLHSNFPPPLTNQHHFCVAPDGQSFLVSNAGSTDDHRPLRMVMGWTRLTAHE